MSVDWKPLPAMWTSPAVWTDVGDLMLLVFMQNAVPTWEVHSKAKIETNGVAIEVSIPDLIEEVFVSPSATPWFATVVSAMTVKCGYALAQNLRGRSRQAHTLCPDLSDLELFKEAPELP